MTELRLALCRRCREPLRRAAGACEAAELLSLARSAAGGAVAVRLAHCLHGCEWGHTARIEWGAYELTIAGVRDAVDLAAALEVASQVEGGTPPGRWGEQRAVHVWVDGRLAWHRGLGGAPPAPPGCAGTASGAGGSE